MIIDHRTYTFRPGTIQEHIKRYEEKGYPVQTRHLGEPVGWYYSEIGTLNQVIHMWAYEDLADRSRKRAAMQADPEWQAYLKESAELGYLVKQRNSILIPAPFFKPQG